MVDSRGGAKTLGLDGLVGRIYTRFQEVFDDPKIDAEVVEDVTT